MRTFALICLAGIAQAIKEGSATQGDAAHHGGDDCMKHVSEGMLNLFDDNHNGKVDREEFQLAVDHAGDDFKPILGDIDAYFKQHGDQLDAEQARGGFESILKHFGVPEHDWCKELEHVGHDLAEAKWGPEPDHHDEKYAQYEDLFHRVFDKLDSIGQMDGLLHAWEFADVAWGLKQDGMISEEDAMGAEMWWWDNHGESTDRDGMANALIMLAEHEGEEMVADILHMIDGHVQEMNWDDYWKGYDDAMMDMHMMHHDEHHADGTHGDASGEMKLAQEGEEPMTEGKELKKDNKKKDKKGKKDP